MDGAMAKQIAIPKLFAQTQMEVTSPQRSAGNQVNATCAKEEQYTKKKGSGGINLENRWNIT